MELEDLAPVISAQADVGTSTAATDSVKPYERVHRKDVLDVNENIKTLLADHAAGLFNPAKTELSVFLNKYPQNPIYPAQVNTEALRNHYLGAIQRLFSLTAQFVASKEIPSIYNHLKHSYLESVAQNFSLDLLVPFYCDMSIGKNRLTKELNARKSLLESASTDIKQRFPTLFPLSLQRIAFESKKKMIEGERQASATKIDDLKAKIATLQNQLVAEEEKDKGLQREDADCSASINQIDMLERDFDDEGNSKVKGLIEEDVQYLEEQLERIKAWESLNLPK